MMEKLQEYNRAKKEFTKEVIRRFKERGVEEFGVKAFRAAFAELQKQEGVCVSTPMRYCDGGFMEGGHEFCAFNDRMHRELGKLVKKGLLVKERIGVKVVYKIS